MIDSEFDDFTKGKLGNHEVPVPAGLWDKISDTQFDNFFGNKLKDQEATVPDGLWDKITDTQFDHFFGNTLTGATAPVPAGLWDRVSDGQFDSFVSGKLSGYEAPVPPGLWEKIMPEKNDDKGGFIWFRSAGRAAAVLLILVGLLGGGYYWYNTTKKSNSTNKADSTAPAASPSVEQQSNNPTVTPSTSAEESSTVKGTEDDKTQENTVIVPGHNPSGNRLEDQRTDASSGSTINSGRKTDQPARPVHANKNTGSGNDITGGRTGSSSTNAGNSVEQNTTGVVTDQSADDFGFKEPYQTNHLSASTIPTGHFTGFSMINKQLSPNHANRHKSVIICPADKGRNTDWYVEGFLSPDLAFSSITNNTASPQFLARKDSSENMNIGFTAGIRLVKPLTDNILLKTGLQFSQMNQKYVYRTENEIKTITVVSQRTIIRAPGDTVIIMDTSVVQQVGFKNNTVINRFRSLDIPVLVGYQFGTKDDDIRIGINAGVIVNLSSWYQGVMLDSALATVPITKGSSNMVYKSKVGLGLYGGISITKKLGEDMQVFAEPYFRYNLSNMTTPNASYNQKFSIGGVSLGVRINLNRQ